MNLTQALFTTINRFDLPFTVQELITYAQEDKHGGRDTGEFPVGVSVNRVEGQFLYALIRALRPLSCVEVGCADGASATHMLAALEKNGEGELISYDLNAAAGGMIPKEYWHRWRLVVGDAEFASYPKRIDFAFEDGGHGFQSTYHTLNKIKGAKAVVIHDFHLHYGVRGAFYAAFGENILPILFDDTITGLGCWIHDGQTA